MFIDPQTGEYEVCFGSFSLENVRKWLSEEFEIVAAPTVDAVEVVHGRWIDDYDTFVQDNGYESEPIHTGVVCSVCGRHSFAIEPYCHCGAKMDGDGNG